VDINLATIKNQSLVEKVRNEINQAEKKVKTFSKEIHERVRAKIKG